MTRNGVIMNNNNDMIRRNEKYEKLIAELKKRLKNKLSEIKKKTSEYRTRLKKAKQDIDEERKRRIAVERDWEATKVKSQEFVEGLQQKLETNKKNHTDLLNKLKKLETNKKKYKESAAENKKKMRALKEQHAERIAELENDIIPQYKQQIKNASAKTVELAEKLKNAIQISTQSAQTVQAMQSYKQQLDSMYTQFNGVQQQLQLKTNELTRLQNENSQIQHKMKEMHVQATANHQQWELLNKTKDSKINEMKKKLTKMHQSMNINMNNTESNNDSGTSTPRPPKPVTIPPTPSYLKFNELEMEELKMCRDLCQKLLHANLFQIDHMAQRIQLNQQLFQNWVFGTNQQPTVINDLNIQSDSATPLPQLNPNEHLSMNCIRCLLIEIRKQLETLSKDNTLDQTLHRKVVELLNEFQSASAAYEEKMQRFKTQQHQKLLEECSKPDNIIQVVQPSVNGGSDIWVNAKVIRFDQVTQRVLYQKIGQNDVAYSTLDANMIRLIDSSPAQNNTNTNSSPSMLNGNNASGIANGMSTFNHTNAPQMTSQINFNNMPNMALPQIDASLLPSFDALQANNPMNIVGATNMINVNDANGTVGTGNHPIIVDDDDNISRKSSSRKRKRHESSSKSHKKKKRSKHKHDVSDSDDSDSSTESDDSDLLSSSDVDDSDSESMSSSKSKKKKHKKKKKRHKKSKKKKHSKKSKKDKKKHHHKEAVPPKKKRGRPSKTKKDANDDDNRSVSVSSTASSRKRRGTKRPITNISKLNGSSNPSKKRKLNNNDGIDDEYIPPSSSTRQFDRINDDFVTVNKDNDSGESSDKNDSICRICKHPGNLVCCEGCPCAYHANCIRPRVKKEWLDKFEEWFCPSCAPRHFFVPLVDKQTNQKWAINKEPLLKDLKAFLKKHPNLQRDIKPDFHGVHPLRYLTKRKQQKTSD